MSKAPDRRFTAHISRLIKRIHVSRVPLENPESYQVGMFLPHTQEYMVMKILAIDLGKYKSVACLPAVQNAAGDVKETSRADDAVGR